MRTAQDFVLQRVTVFSHSCVRYKELTCPAFATGDGPRYVRSGAPRKAHFFDGAGLAGAHFFASTRE